MIIQNYKKYLWLIFLCLVACTVVDEITPRSYVGLLWGNTGTIRVQIADDLLNKRTIKSNPLILSEPNAIKTDFAWITQGGSIVVRNNVTVIFEPRQAGNKITWGCITYPEKVAPTFCKVE